MASQPSPSTFSLRWAGSPEAYGSNTKAQTVEPLVNPLLNATTPSPKYQGQQDGGGIQRLQQALLPLDANAGDGLRQRRSASTNGGIKMRTSGGSSSRMTQPPPPTVSLSMQQGFVGATKKEAHKLDSISTTNNNGTSGSLSKNSIGPRVSWGRMDSLESPPPNNSSFGTDVVALVESYDRWVLVYGYANKSQYDALLKMFENFGKVTARKGTCRPGQSNWLALQYETSLQAEKALCQQHCMLDDGVLVGVTRMDNSIKQSLSDWNVMAPAYSSKEEEFMGGGNRLEDKFRHTSQNGSSYGMTEQDVLLTESPLGGTDMTRNGRKNPCEQFLSWVFDW